MSSSRSLRPWPRRCTTRAGEEESETKYTAKFRTNPPPQPVPFSLYDEEPGGRRLPAQPDILRFFDTLMPDPEQVIEVPKISPEDVSMRTAAREPQLVKQLVEVPTLAGRGQRCRGPHVVPGLWTAWSLVVAVGFAPHPMGPPVGVHRQARAV